MILQSSVDSAKVHCLLLIVKSSTVLVCFWLILARTFVGLKLKTNLVIRKLFVEK